ncbi:hypothetical protein NQD34_009210 [Periophthalmus magnuspinnatus]|nr:hypothetical protein NQD34_009210 [Periophthalmus magnuspinnatus]
MIIIIIIIIIMIIIMIIIIIIMTIIIIIIIMTIIIIIIIIITIIIIIIIIIIICISLTFYPVKNEHVKAALCHFSGGGVSEKQVEAPDQATGQICVEASFLRADMGTILN